MSKQETVMLPPLHFPKVKFDDDFSVLVAMVRMIYYLTKIESGEIVKVKKLPEKVVMACSLYIMYGWSEEGKKAVMNVCKCKDRASLNSLNKLLRDFGFMEKDVMNNRTSNLNNDLKMMRQAYLYKKENDIDNMTFSVTFFNEN